MGSGDATKLTVYVGDSSRYRRKKLYHAIVEALQDEGIAGATVLHGIEGYGVDEQIHTARILDLSNDLSVIVIAVDRTEKIEAFLPKLDAIVQKGPVTTRRCTSSSRVRSLQVELRARNQAPVVTPLARRCRVARTP